MDRATNVWLRTAAVLALVTVTASACLTVDDRSDGTPTRKATAENVAGQGISRIAKATTTGTKGAIGTFGGGEAIFGLDHGVVLSTGRAADITSADRARVRSTDNGRPGDPDVSAWLSRFNGGPGSTVTKDAASLSFDFVPDSGNIVLDYVLATEEGTGRSGVHDGAVVLVNGQQCYENGSQGTPRTTHDSIDNRGPGPLDTSMDWVGFERRCYAQTNAGVVNHLKVVVADNVDASLDTNVLIGADSLRTNPAPTWTVTIDPVVHLDPATHQTTVTGTISDCNRAFSVVADPDIELAQAGSPGARAFTHIGLIDCAPGEVVSWSSPNPFPSPSPPFFEPGPARVKAYTIAYELDGTESSGGGPASDPEADVTIVVDHPS